MDHMGSRFSERFAPNSSAKPLKSSLGASGEGTKRGYGNQTLYGNWSEERWDSMYSDNHPALHTELAGTWCTTKQHMDHHAAKKKSAAEVALTQEQRVQVQNGRFRCFPGHQPEKDPNHERLLKETWGTETRSSYGNPAALRADAEVDAYIPPAGAIGQDAQAYAIMHRVKTMVLKQPLGFTGLRRSLRRMDADGSGMLNNRELQVGLSQFGAEVSDAEVKVLMRFFDREGSGVVSLVAFVKGVRGDMNERRRLVVQKAWKLIEGCCAGIVRLRDIKRLYDVAHHPKVVDKTWTPTQAISTYAETWDLSDDDIVSFDEFIEYYNDASTLIDADYYFELMIRNTWHISGGEGLCANTSCRRVLVIHTNGRQTQEEIKNDLGISADERDKMLANLLAQGITDVARIELK